MKRKRTLPYSWFTSPVRVPLGPAVQSEVINRTIPLRSTDHPSTDRHVQVRTYFRSGHPIYVVGVVNGFNAYTDPSPREYADPTQANAAANRLLTRERKQDTNGAAS